MLLNISLLTQNKKNTFYHKGNNFTYSLCFYEYKVKYIFRFYSKYIYIYSQCVLIMRHEEKYLNILMLIILKWVSLSTLFTHLKDYSHSILSLIDSSLQFIWNDHGSVVLSLKMAAGRKKCINSGCLFYLVFPVI